MLLLHTIAHLWTRDDRVKLYKQIDYQRQNGRDCLQSEQCAGHIFRDHRIDFVHCDQLRATPHDHIPTDTAQ